MFIVPKRIPEETKQRAVRLVLDHLDEYPNLTAACETVSARLGFGAESLRRWVRQAQVDSGQHEGLTSSESERVRRLERENRELREANAILRDAAVFFAGDGSAAEEEALENPSTADKKTLNSARQKEIFNEKLAKTRNGQKRNSNYSVWNPRTERILWVSLVAIAGVALLIYFVTIGPGIVVAVFAV